MQEAGHQKGGGEAHWCTFLIYIIEVIKMCYAYSINIVLVSLTTKSMTLPIINNIISSNPNSFIIIIIDLLSLKKLRNFNDYNAFAITKNNADQMN